MKSYKIEKYIIWDIVGIILFKIVLDFSYTSFVVPYYEYMGFTLDFNLFKYIQGWIVYFILFLLLNRHKMHVLYMTLLISFLLLIVPTITLYSFKNEPSEFFYSMILPYMGMLLAITTKRVQLYYFPHGKKIAIGLSLFIIFFVLIHYLLTVGIGHINFNISEVYELRRSDYGIASNAGIFGYFNPWTTKVLNIFLITIALLHRKYLLVILFILIQVLFFGFSGHRAVLFSLILILGLYLFSKAKHHSTIIIYGILGTISLVLIYFYIFQNLMLPSVLVRRAFFVPANLNYIYFDYFSSNDYIYWSNSILKSIFIYPYEVSPVLVIGDYLGYPEMAANTGVFGSGYMHLGILGILLYMFIISIVVNFIQQFNKVPFWIINAIVLMPFLSIFISSDLPTAFLTHGLLIGIIILYFYSTQKIKGKND